MKISISAKIRAIGGASALALTAGLTANAAAQAAPAPFDVMPDAPTAPDAPTDLVQCELDGNTIDCPVGLDPDGTGEDFDTDPGMNDGLTVNIVEGAFVAGDNGLGAVEVGIDGTVNNSGTVVGDNNGVVINSGVLNNDGFIQANGNVAFGSLGPVEVNNTGTISVTETGDFAVVVGGDSTINNSGLIQSNGSSFGVLVDNSGEGAATVNNSVTGTIIAANESAVFATGDLTVVNDGLIQSFGANGDGISIIGNGDVTNTGNIVSDAFAGVFIGGEATITNSGLILGADEGVLLDGGGTVTNEAGGVIEGDIGVNGFDNTDTVINFGTITGTGGNAVLLANGDDTFQQWQSGVTDGLVDGGDGVDTLIFGNDGDTLLTRDLDDIGDPAQYTGFETIGFLDIGGGIALDGDSDLVLTLLGGALTINGELSRTLTIADEATLTVSETGEIETTDEFAVFSDADNVTLINAGGISSDGDNVDTVRLIGDLATVTNSGTISGSGDFTDAIRLRDNGTVTNTGLVSTNGLNAFGIITGADSTIVNDGTVMTEGDFSPAIATAEGSTVTLGANSVVTATGDNSSAVELFGATLSNSGSIEATGGGDLAVGVLAVDASSVTNTATGTIASTNDAGILFRGEGGSLNNAGLIQSGTSTALILADADMVTVTNSGTIEALDTDMVGGLLAVDAGDNLDFTNDGGTVSAAGGTAISIGGEGGTVTNNAGGLISGAIGIDATGGTGSQSVVNFGTITGFSLGADDAVVLGTAVLLGEGDDEFQQWTGASVDGDIDLGAGDDSFILEGTASSIDGTIFGGDGNDTATLAGILDADNFDGFETFQLGSMLGGTLNDLTITGNRTVDGDVVQVGIVNVNLGTASLTSTGSITLEDTGVLNIGTSLNRALVGQTVDVFVAGTTFTNNGATINILDNDLLIDYALVGGLAVQVTAAANPLTIDGDANVVAFGNALNNAFLTGTLSDARFNQINALPDAATLRTFALDSLPALNEGAGREIFETSQVASEALSRHIADGRSGIWGQVVYREADQDSFGASTQGYNSDQVIYTLGADYAFGEAGRIGVIASYADIENFDDSLGGQRGNMTEVDSYKVGGYAAYTLGEQAFINAEVSYIAGDVTQIRFGLPGVNASEFDFDGLVYNATAGFDVLPSDNFSLLVTAGVSGASISFDDAVETIGFGFNVARDDADFLELRGGLELNGQITPALSGFLSGVFAYDLEDDQRLFALSSADLGTFTVALPEREQSRYELGAGLSLSVSEGFALEVGYLGDFASGYDAHSGRLTGRMRF